MKFNMLDEKNYLKSREITVFKKAKFKLYLKWKNSDMQIWT